MRNKKLDKLIEEATIDCYDIEECKDGFFNLIEEHLRFPFPAHVVGEDVEVIGIQFGDTGIQFKCYRKGKVYTVDIYSIDYNPKNVSGSELIDAYKQWMKNN